ncbi:MAG TPA: polymorphic toxin type 24 domain-containing protein [Chitinophagaceae bacterium]|nr:polymorphic toxin type 24 domain-containing protein [Chitinophagaceae bacterium]
MSIPYAKANNINPLTGRSTVRPQIEELPYIAPKPLAATVTEQAAALSNELGRNSVTLGTSSKQIRFDLVGKAHGDVPTPHMQVYNKNFVNGVQKSITRASKVAIPMTQQGIRIIRNYLRKQYLEPSSGRDLRPVK